MEAEFTREEVALLSYRQPTRCARRLQSVAGTQSVARLRPGHLVLSDPAPGPASHSRRPCTGSAAT